MNYDEGAANLFAAIRSQPGAVGHLSNALRAAHEAGKREAQRWLPIADAPRDGTPVLVCDASTGSMRWAVWSDGFWLDGQAGVGDAICGCPCPTAYMPLPPPPEDVKP